MTKITTADQAVAAIPDGATIASTGVIGWVTPDHCLEALGRRYRETGMPRNLTAYLPVGTGDAMRPFRSASESSLVRWKGVAS